MNLSRLVPFVVLCLVTLIGHAQTDDQVVTRTIDWERGTISITIRRPIPVDAPNKPAAISRVQSEIQRDAVGIIATQLTSLTYDSYYTMDELLNEDEKQIRNLLAAAEQAQAVDAKSSPDLQNTEVTFELDINRDVLAHFVHHEHSVDLPPLLRWVPTRQYSGIIIYAAEPLPIHGTDRVELIRPALRPGIYYYGESKREIYRLAEAIHVAPDFLVRWGGVGYTDWIDESSLFSRVGATPLRIMAYGGFGRYPTDLVLTKFDAEQILGNAANRQLVAEGRIAVILSTEVLEGPPQP